MYCNKCGNKLNDNENFCQKCGNNIQPMTQQIFEHNPQTNLTDNQQTSSSTQYFKSIHEKVLIVLNTILWGFIIYYFYLGFSSVVGPLLFDILFMIFILLFGGESFMFTKQALTKLDNQSPIFMILLIVLVIFNGIMCYIMYKKNKHNPNVNIGLKVSKLKYLLTIYFLGLFGVHRFMIKDKQGGKLRLLLTVANVLVLVIAIALNINLLYIHIVLLGCAFGLETSDFTIALAKISDNEKKILI